MFQLPARAASQRVSVWRKLKKYGALPWRDSAYILPNTPAHLEKFQWLLAEIRKHRGSGSVLRVAEIEGLTHRQVVTMFNDARLAEYERLLRDLSQALQKKSVRDGAGRAGAAQKLRRHFEEISALDFFGCPLRREAEKMLGELDARLDTANEQGKARKLHVYRGRVWLTRPRPGVDRVGSAWLIRRFIDPKSRFVFSADPRAHPGAIRFDMFEGEFTHEGDDCTFETLLRRFDLREPRLRSIARIVHDADLEDGKFGRVEGFVIQNLLEGWARMGWSDEEILRRGFDLYDALHHMLPA
jgi:hypothetical protein